MSSLEDKILNKTITKSKDGASVKIRIEVPSCKWLNGERPITVSSKKVKRLLISEGYNVESVVKSSQIYNDVSSMDNPPSSLEATWEFSLKTTKTTTKTQTKKKAPAKTNLTNDTKSATVTQKDQQQEDSESVE